MKTREKNPRRCSRDELILSNMRIVYSLAKKFASELAEKEDYEGYGMIGLIKAADRFDPEFGCEFSTLATHLILSEMRRYKRDQATLIKSRAASDAREVYNRAERCFCNVLGRLPENTQELADFFECDDSLVYRVEALRSDYGVVSLDEKLITGSPQNLPNITRAELLASCHISTDSWLQHILIENALSRLPEKQEYILRRYYLDRQTEREIAESMGLPQPTVATLKRRGIKKLQDIFGVSRIPADDRKRPKPSPISRVKGAEVQEFLQKVRIIEKRLQQCPG